MYIDPTTQIQQILLRNDYVPDPVLGAVTYLTGATIITSTKKNSS